MIFSKYGQWGMIISVTFIDFIFDNKKTKYNYNKMKIKCNEKPICQFHSDEPVFDLHARKK